MLPKYFQHTYYDFNKITKYLIGSIFILYFVCNLYNFFIIPYVANCRYESFQYTEFLINYESGFVRRGLMGQILLNFVKLTGFSPYYTVITFSFIIYISILSVIIFLLHKKGFCWWWAFTGMTCCYMTDIVRKDYLCLLLIALSLLILSHRNTATLRSHKLIYYATIIIGVFGLFLHEAFLFWGCPIIILLSNKYGGGAKSSCIYFSPDFYFIKHIQRVYA